MKKLLVVSLIGLVLGPAQAQLTLMGVSAGGGFVGPADIVGSPVAFWGFRAMSAAIAAAGTQPLFAAQRASDSQFCDFLVASNGGVGNSSSCSGAFGTGTLASFCNATTCTVKTFYDQTGHGNNGGATGAAQPTLVQNCLGSLPCLQASGTQQITATPFSTTVSQPFTVIGVANCTAAASCGTQNTFIIADSGLFQFLFGGGSVSNKLSGYLGNFVPSVAASANAAHSVIGTFDGSSSSSGALAVDGTNTTGLNFGASATGNVSGTVNIPDGSTNPFTGQVMELGVYSGAFSGSQITNMSHNQCSYWGTPTAC